MPVAGTTARELGCAFRFLSHRGEGNMNPRLTFPDDAVVGECSHHTQIVKRVKKRHADRNEVRRPPFHVRAVSISADTFVDDARAVARVDVQWHAEQKTCGLEEGQRKMPEIVDGTLRWGVVEALP